MRLSKLFCISVLLLCLSQLSWTDVNVNALNVAHKRCKWIFHMEDKIEGTGCVNKSAIPTMETVCNRCLYNYQCASNWCHSEAKVCYQQGIKCTIGEGAGCSLCPSIRGVNLQLCNCTNLDFPNKWVNCYDGSADIDHYKKRLRKPNYVYERTLDKNGNLHHKRDLFARYIQCYHNKYREEIGLKPLNWRHSLAQYAKSYLLSMKEENQCSITHSSAEARSNIFGHWRIGENLYRKRVKGPITMNHIAKLGRSAVEGWYGEMKYYQYPGEDYGSGQCPHRNVENRTTSVTIFHATQVLWQNTFEMGCDYEICNATNSSDYSYAMVSCNYGATGNIAGSAAFDESIYENINNNENFTGRFGHLPRCEVNSIEEVQPQVSDNICPVKLKNGTEVNCVFPHQEPGWRELTSCQHFMDNRPNATKAQCFAQNGDGGVWRPCPQNSGDPDCDWTIPNKSDYLSTT